MPKPYPRDFRDAVVAVVTSPVTVAQSREPGLSIKRLATDFGISETCLKNWMRPAEASS